MVPVVVGVCLVVGSLLFVLQWRSVKQMQREVVDLVARAQAGASAQHVMPSPLVGLNIREDLAWPAHWAELPAVVFVASPTCGPCHLELEKVLKSYPKGLPVPFLVVAHQGDPAALEMFVASFGQQVPILTVPEDVFKFKWSVRVFPTVMMVSATGVVVEEGQRAAQAIAQLKQAGLRRSS